MCSLPFLCNYLWKVNPTPDFFHMTLWNSSAGVLGNEGAAPLSRKSWKISVGGKFGVWSKTQVRMWPLTSRFRTIARSVEKISLYLPANVWTRGLNVSSFFVSAVSNVALQVFGHSNHTVSWNQLHFFCFAFMQLVSRSLVVDVWSQLPTSSHWCNLSN